MVQHNWLKIVCHKGNSLVCKIYDSLYKRLNEDENIINCASLTRNLLFKLGFADVWLAQGVGNTHRFLNICKQRLQDQFIQGWFGDKENGSAMELYTHVKVKFSSSLYFNVVTFPKYRYAMCTFFDRNHRLANVSGRWLGQPRNERLCQHCQELEDEYHFVLIC